MPKRASYSLLLPAIVLVSAFALVFQSARHSRPPAPSSSYSMGQGPTVVLVHGLGSKVEHWLPVARRLARTHRVVLAELPGHGTSEMPEPLTVERAALALEGTIAREAREPVTLVGHSIGGLVAARLAIDRPRLVRSLVLIETSLRPPMTQRERLGMLELLDRDYRGLVHAAYTSFGRDSAQGERLADDAQTLDPAMMKPWIRLALSADLSAEAADLRVPIVAVLADRSWPRDESWVQTARALGYERVRRIEPVRLENCGHFAMLDRPSDVARIIARAAGGDSETVGAATPR